MQEAEAVLNDKSARRMKNWKNKVLTINEGLQLKQANIKKNVLSDIHRALWEEKTIEATYISKNKTFPSKYNIHPAGLVYRGRICYLICSFNDVGPASTTYINTKSVHSIALHCNVFWSNSLQATC